MARAMSPPPLYTHAISEITPKRAAKPPALSKADHGHDMEGSSEDLETLLGAGRRQPSRNEEPHFVTVIVSLCLM